MPRAPRSRRDRKQSTGSTRSATTAPTEASTVIDIDSSLILECEKEPLAHSGLIQPYGTLLFIDKQTGAIHGVGANSAELLGEAPAQLLGQDGHEWLEQNLPDLGALPANAGKRIHLIAALDLGHGELDVLVSPSSAGWILEFEPSIAEQTPADGYGLEPVTGPIDATRLEQLQQNLVETVRAMTGYARVMLYRFHADWSGEVIAEAARPGQGTYLGLRFPASDIPAIARALYAQTPYRHIPDALAPPVALLSRTGDGTQLDLTWSDLRSVSPVHAQYLSNMQVRSSFSVSVMLEGRLWGLIACHHPQPLAISLPRRQRCKTLASEYVESLESFRKSAQRAVFASLTAALTPIEQALAQGEALADTLTAGFSELAPLFGVTAGVLFIDHRPTLLGDARDPETLARLHQWCLVNQSETLFATDHLPAAISPEPLSEAPRGVLSIGWRASRLGEVMVNLYLLRPEEAGEIAWAGNPEKPMESTPDGLQLSPRHSFEKWVEVRHGYSRAWDEDTLFAARQLRDQLMRWL